MEKHNLSMQKLRRMMHEVYRVFKKSIEEQQHEGIKISPEQFGLLHAISTKDEEVIQKDMAEMMGKNKSAILRLIDSLEEKELVRRVADVKDRRKNYLMVTKVGYKVLDQYMRVVHELMEEMQQGLTQNDIDTFHKVVNHIKCKAEKL
ncbi:MAG: MarR family transcriptional regulator [Salinivirgaceae bacterium]|nr:MarR family transcriptional regulator [Salinivirgaceae bacterium]